MRGGMLLLALALASGGIPFFPDAQGATAAAVPLALTPHASIVIEGDANFTRANGVTGGRGTAANPYVIDSWDLNASAGVAVQIRNTSAYFVIRNVLVRSDTFWYDGILLYQVQHARVENVTVTGTQYGVHAEGVRDLVVGWSNLSANNGAGVHVVGSDLVTVAGNGILENSLVGIEILSTTNATVSTNLVTTLQKDSIWIEDCWGVWITRNRLLGNESWYGGVRLLVATSNNVTVEDNEIVAGQSLMDFGIDVYGSVGVTLRRNSLTGAAVILREAVEGDLAAISASLTIAPDNLINGRPVRYYSDCSDIVVEDLLAGELLFANCHDVRIQNLHMDGSPLGILLIAVRNVTVTASTFSGMEWGVYLWIGTNVTVYHNDFIDSRGAGADHWDVGYPKGGNYWSSYVASGTARDNCSGPDQDVCPDPDGFADTPYPPEPFASISDRFPLMTPFDRNNTWPRASFTVSPAAADAGTTFSFNATASSDREDPATSLEVRWDWDGDSHWDTPWSTEKLASHRFAAAGTYRVALEVRDSGGLLSISAVNVAVSAVPLSAYLLSPLAFAAYFAVAVVAVLYLVARVRRRPRTPSGPT